MLSKTGVNFYTEKTASQCGAEHNEQNHSLSSIALFCN